MSDQGDKKPADQGKPADFGEFAPNDPGGSGSQTDTSGAVPVQDWITTPVFDSAEYLDRPVPTYAEEGQDTPDATTADGSSAQGSGGEGSPST